MDSERCICCGSIIPKGRQVCGMCEAMVKDVAPYIMDGLTMCDKGEEIRFNRTLLRRDVAELLDCENSLATDVLKKFGKKLRHRYAIGEREFKMLQAEGVISEFVASVLKDRKRKESKA